MIRYIKPFLFALFFVVALMVGSPLVGQETPADDPVVVHPNQRASVPNLAVITSTNTSGAAAAKAALAIVVSGSRLKCDNGSEIESVAEANGEASLGTIAAKLSSAVCMVNGRPSRIRASFVPNGSIQANSIIVSIKAGEPLLVKWRNSVYVLYGVVYDERLHPSGSQDNAIRELLLIDPRYSDKRRQVVFERDKDNFAEIEGIASVSVTGE